MPDPKGQKLFVNLGASQTRRRLKGFGHGVRPVQTAGRSRATIIHTATGRHLQELEAKFADVGFSHSETDLAPTVRIANKIPSPNEPRAAQADEQEATEKTEKPS
jgi:hypothetical protein